MTEEEILDIRPRTFPPWMVGLGILLVAVIAGWTLARVAGGKDEAGPPAATTSAAPSTSTSSPAAVFDDSIRGQSLQYVFESAHHAAPPGDVVRTDGSTRSCPLVPLHTRPWDRARALVHAALPSYSITDVTRLIDHLAGLCYLDLRAREVHGTVLIVHVVAPVEDAYLVAPRIDTGKQGDAESSTQFVKVTSHSGWMVTVGTSGPAQYAPQPSRLTTLAEQPSLTW